MAYTPRRPLALDRAARTARSRRINVRTLKEERTYSGHNEDVLAVAVHPDGKRFVSAGNEPQIRWWSFEGDKPAGAARRPLRAGAAARLQRRRPAADLGGRRPLRAALGRKDGRSRSGSLPAPPSGNTRQRSPTTAGSPPPAAGTAWSGSGTPTPAGSVPPWSSRRRRRRAAASPSRLSRPRPTGSRSRPAATSRARAS